MNTLPATSIVIRLNALAAAAVVTVTMLAAITTLAHGNGSGAATQWARVAAAQPV